MNFRKKFVFYKFFDENQVRKFFRIKKSTAGTAESYASGDDVRLETSNQAIVNERRISSL